MYTDEQQYNNQRFNNQRFNNQRFGNRGYNNQRYNNQRGDNKKIFKIIGIIVISICVIALIVFIINKIKDSKVVFTLMGTDVTLKMNEKYVEPGYSCLNGDSNYEKQVEVTDNIVYKKPGVYTVTYKCRGKVLTRKVTVLEPSSYELTINLTPDKTNYTNDSVNIKYEISGEAFLEVLLPSGYKSDENVGNTSISANGTYQIKAFNIRNEEFVKEITINNIDKEKPTGKCDAVIKNKNTEITVTATDNVGVTKYEYYDDKKILDTGTKNTYTSSGLTSKSITVKVFDEAGNSEELVCNVTEKKYMDPIKPSPGENIVYQAETETLKVYITHKDEYYLTRIWALDAYSQLHKAASPEYGSRVYFPMDLFKKAVNNNNLHDKLVLGFNASGFYLKGTFDAWSVEKYRPYDKTAVGTIVINNGQVVRNAYDHAVKQWYLLGINKNNEMVIFEDNVATTAQEIANKQAWAQTVINSGIRNTFSFAGPVIENGKVLTTVSESMPDPQSKTPKKLQLICQMDENNFVLFTAQNTNRNVAVNLFASMGCKTAFNFDGGGSIALFYKPKNSDTFTKVIGGGRELPEAAYFTE